VPCWSERCLGDVMFSDLDWVSDKVFVRLMRSRNCGCSSCVKYLDDFYALQEILENSE